MKFIPLLFSVLFLLFACSEHQSTSTNQNLQQSYNQYDTLVKDYLSLLEKEEYSPGLDFNTMLLRLVLLNDSTQFHGKRKLIEELKNRPNQDKRLRKLNTIHEAKLNEQPLIKYLENAQRGSVVRLNLWKAFYPYDIIVRLEINGDSSKITRKLISYNYEIQKCNSFEIDSLSDECFSIKEEITKSITKEEAQSLFQYIFWYSDLKYLKSDSELKYNVCSDGAIYKIEALEKFGESDGKPTCSKFTVKRHCPGKEGPLVKVSERLLEYFEKE